MDIIIGPSRCIIPHTWQLLPTEKTAYWRDIRWTITIMFLLIPSESFNHRHWQHKPTCSRLLSVDKKIEIQVRWGHQWAGGLSLCYLKEMTIPSDLYLKFLIILATRCSRSRDKNTQYLQFQSPMCLHPQCHVWPGDIRQQFSPSERNIKYDQNCPGPVQVGYIYS